MGVVAEAKRTLAPLKMVVVKAHVFMELYRALCLYIMLLMLQLPSQGTLRCWKPHIKVGWCNWSIYKV